MEGSSVWRGNGLGRIWILLVLGFATMAAAQSITPANWTTNTTVLENDNGVKLWMSRAGQPDWQVVASVLGLTGAAKTNVPMGGLAGPIDLTVEDKSSSGLHDIVIIQCDPIPGYLQPTSLFSSAVGANVTAILFYSRYSDYCALENYDSSYTWVYTMKSQNASLTMLRNFLNEGESYGLIKAASDTSVSDANGKHNNPLGPSPSTAVAMIILYSITGVITALFMVIVVTGAMRAHRHPERYGPRNNLGRPRQSRARGLARAMLDTIPIVKFGQAEEPKPADVELADTNTITSGTGTADGEVGATQEVAAKEAQQPQTEQALPPTESGIAAADPKAEQVNHQGCSICTEDFEAGQDQRVLPCDHRFHPDCIDPWLLNVSGTCPLCRIDLRPHTSNASDAGEGEVDENGNPYLREGVPDPPPLNAQEPSTSDRRRVSTAILDLMGIGRPDRLSREERVLALRQMRGQRLARQRREGSSAAEHAIPESPEEESSTRRRLRRVFGVRTRRTDENGEQVEVQEEPDARA